MEIKVVEVDVPEGCNVIIGQTHFIKTVEDIYEAIVNTVPQAKFGIGFCEASGKRLVRHEGNDEELRKLAAENALRIGAGHTFVIYLRDAWPINILERLKHVPEVCTIYCATANPVKALVVEVEQKDGEKGRALIGVVDGFSPKGIETEEDIRERREFLRKIGYKF